MSDLSVIVSAHVEGPSNLYPLRWPQRTMIESPLGGDFQRNLEYARLCMRHSMLRCQEAPMAFHLLYPQSLCDDTDEERAMGIERSFAWHDKAEQKVFYLDRGFSAGMAKGLEAAIRQNTPITFRSLSLDSEMMSLIDTLNRTEPARIPVKEIAQKLLERRDGNFGNDAEPGDLSGFRKFFKKEIAIVNALKSQPDEHRQLLYPRVLMRNSLVEHGESPLVMELLVNQLLGPKESLSPAVISRPWELMADTVVVGIDAGINQVMVDRAMTLLGKGASLKLRTLTGNPVLIEELERINERCDPDARVGELVRNWKDVMTKAGLEAHAHTLPYQRRHMEDIRRVASLNHEAYRSRERELEDAGQEPT